MLSLKALVVVAVLGLTLPQGTMAVPADTIDKYTVQYFLDNKLVTPPGSSCVFYTRDLTTKAQAFANGRNMFTIWDVWSGGATQCGLYNRAQDDSNPLRDILKKNADGTNTADGQTYFEHMSEAFAALCSGTATLLTLDPNNVPLDGIWGRIEFKRLQMTGNPGGQVDVVEGCDGDGTNCLVPPYWTRPTPRRVRRSPVVATEAVDAPLLGKRQCAECDPLPNPCYTPEELGDIFSDIDPLW